MSKKQAERVSELLKRGWKTVPENPPPPPGGGVLVEDLNGKQWVVNSNGDLAPVP